MENRKEEDYNTIQENIKQINKLERELVLSNNEKNSLELQNEENMKQKDKDLKDQKDKMQGKINDLEN